jgi:outer membrane receptor protein involved in Fe transport
VLLPCAIAQTPGVEVRVTVKDSSGAVMGAFVRLENLASGAVRSIQPDESVVYAAKDIAPGRYRLEVSRPGFASWSEVINVHAGAALAREVTLRLGPAAERIDVVESMPLAGLNVPVTDVPTPVQAISAQHLEESGALDLAAFLKRQLIGVNVNETQENPYQPDVNYRGYTASPLLGTPEGLSVYVDGVRMNQPFGDIVSWDLIPKIAIQEATLMPGANPVFGLNTLGGALSVQTKDGITHPGTSLESTGGSNGRRAVEFEHGGSRRSALNWYLAGNLFHEDGWRPLSPSDVRQSFARIGWQRTKTTVGLTASYVYNDLWGHGPQEQRMLARDYSSGYTLSDETVNRSPFFNLTLRRAASPNVTFSANAYFRYIRADTFNTDFNSDSLTESVYQPSAADQAALTRAGYTGFPSSGATAANTPFPKWRCIAQVLLRDEPGEKCNAFLTRSWTMQHNFGAAGQMTWSSAPAGLKNQFTPGFAIDHSGLDFRQTREFAYINPDRTMTGLGLLVDGSTNINGAPFDERVDLRGTPGSWSLFAADTLASPGRWSVTASARFNRVKVNNYDRLVPGGPESLSGRYVFSRLNPAIGFTFTPVKSVNAYVGYNEGGRAPTSIELGCADAFNPCHLPNSLVSDPPLRQVVARTFETGIRSTGAARLNWSLGWFLAENHDDLLFVASAQANNGYFKNFGRTQRLGATAALDACIRRVTVGGSYTFVDATYQSTETVSGSANSTNDAGTPGLDGDITIHPGDRIPMIPHHIVKGFVEWAPAERFFVEVSANALSKSYARGNENNQHKPYGVYYIGPGTSPGYVVVDLSAHYQAHKHLEFVAQIDNLLNRHYYSGAELAVTGFTPQGTYLARPLPAVNGEFPLVHSTFFSPGAPFAVTGGLRFSF